LQTTRLNADQVKSLYEKHGAALAAYACSCGLDHASAEDVVQQLFAKLLGDKAFVPLSPLAYLYRATRNASLNLRRDRKRETNLERTDFWFVHPTGDQDEILYLQQALRQLPDEQRETLFLKIWSGMTLLEISEMTEIPLNTVASRYRYALEKLRQLSANKGRS
jgi:RNA polymerase sigma-70 factor (ECF subfamily)